MRIEYTIEDHKSIVFQMITHCKSNWFRSRINCGLVSVLQSRQCNQSDFYFLLLFYYYRHYFSFSFQFLIGSCDIALEQCITLESDVLVIKSINWMCLHSNVMCATNTSAVFILYVLFYQIYFQMSCHCIVGITFQFKSFHFSSFPLMLNEFDKEDKLHSLSVSFVWFAPFHSKTAMKISTSSATLCCLAFIKRITTQYT